MDFDSKDTAVNVVIYTAAQAKGITFIVLAGTLSFLAVTGVLAILGISFYRSFKDPEGNAFIRTFVAGYYVSLLLCDFMQSIGAMMNSRWLSESGVRIGSFCTAQAAIKQASNVGTALWTLVIAIHTFNLLFLRIGATKKVFMGIMIGVWGFLFLIMIIGPVGLQNKKTGPFYGISGFWCWISPRYPGPRYSLEYFFMFFSAGTTFCLYILVFLRMRGNIYMDGYKPRFRKIKSGRAWQFDEADIQMINITRQMLLYPFAYTILILPIACSRFVDMSGGRVPFEVTIFAATLFMLSGLVNATLFMATRRVVPVKSLVPTFLRSTSNKEGGGGPSDEMDEKEKDLESGLSPDRRRDSYIPSSSNRDSYNPSSQRRDSYNPSSQRRDSYNPSSQRRDSYNPANRNSFVPADVEAQRHHRPSSPDRGGGVQWGPPKHQQPHPQHQERQPRQQQQHQQQHQRSDSTSSSTNSAGRKSPVESFHSVNSEVPLNQDYKNNNRRGGGGSEGTDDFEQVDLQPTQVHHHDNNNRL